MTETNKYNNQTKLPFRKSHAFIIGINDYLHLNKLTTSVNDAKRLAEVLAREQRFKVHPPLINASYKKIKNLLEKTIIKKVKEEDRVLFYFAGHGIASQGDNIPEGYIMPVDAVKGDVNSYISMKELRDTVNMIPCLHVLLILDCCFAGAFKWSSRYRDSGTLMPKRIYKERFERFAQDPAWQVITSSAYDQLAIDILNGKTIGKRNEEDMLHSPFAEALFKGLQGDADIIPADGGDGLITVTELYLYLRQQVEPQTIALGERRRQTPLLFFLERHDKGEYIFLHPRHRLNLPPIPKREPYKGLKPFEEEDKELFYGRNRVIEELMQKVGERNLVVVTGASGTGKSSVVKAGLIPGLREKGYNILPVIRPGKTPVKALEKAIHQSTLFNRRVSFSRDIKTILEKVNLKKNVLVIDQYEELVTQCQYKEEKNRFIEILKTLLDADKKNLLKIILTVRSDFEPHFKHLGLEQYWQNAVFMVPSFTMGELREIIVNPTIQEVLFFEPPKLVDRIINEVFREPGALPLLSFTLSELYRLYKESKRTDRVLREDDYNKLGGVIGALHRRAGNFFNGLDQKHQNTMRKIMLRMVSIEGTELAGKKVMREELEFSKEEEPCVKDVIAQLLDARLLLKDKDDNGQTYVEPAHDALIRGWATLWEWIEEHGKEKIILQTKLGVAVKDYSIKKVKLWDNDSRLDILKEELQSPGSCLNRHEVSFIEKSIKLRKRKKNRAWTIAISVIIILSGLLIYAINKARTAQANNLASQAQLRLKGDPTIAIRLAEEAYKLDKNKNVLQVLSAAAAATWDHPFYNLNIRHERSVNKAIFSPSGDRILTISSDNTAKLWDLTGKHLKTLQNRDVVYLAEFSPDGTQILTVSGDNSAKLWDWQGKPLKNMTHKATVTSAVFSLDGRWILTASDDHTAKLWDAKKGKEPLKTYWHYMQINSAIFSPDSSRILAITNDNNAVLWNLYDTNPKYKHLKGVLNAEFSPAGTHIIAVNRDYSVKLWDLEVNLVQTFKENNIFPNHATFSPDGTQILIAYSGGAVKLWDFNKKLIKEFNKHRDIITSIVFSPDGTRLLTASADKTAKLWDVNGYLIADMDKHSDRVNCAVFSPDGTKILTASRDNTAKMWDLGEQPTRELNHQRYPVIQAAFSPKGTRILAVSNDQTVQLWNIYGNHEASLKGHSKRIHTAVFSPDGSKIVTASEDGTAKVWDLQGKQLLNLDSHAKPVNWAVFSPDGTRILTASDDKTAGLWNLKGNRLLKLEIHTKAVNRAIFSPDGSKILTASDDGTAKLWNLQGKLLSNFNIHSWGIEMAIFSPDGTKVLTVSTVARLWDINGQLIAGYTRYTGSIQSAVFSPDGSKILTASDKKTAKLWNLEGNPITEFFGHKSIVYSAQFSPDGQRIITASADQTVKLWDLQGNILADFDQHKGIVYSAIFSPSGTRVLSTSTDSTVMIWQTPETLIQWLKTDKIPVLKSIETNFNKVGKDIINK